MQTKSFKKMNGTIARLSDLFTEEFKQKLYDDCEREDTRKLADIVEIIEQKKPIKKASLVDLAAELIGSNAKVLRDIVGLQAQKDYIASRVNSMKGLTEAKRKKFLYGNYGRGGVLTSKDFNGLLTVLTRAALNGSGLAMPYTRRK